MAAMFGKALGATEKDPFPTLEEFLNPQPKLSDEDLFSLAKSKGIDVPEGVI